MIQQLRPWTSINMKVVERAGDKLEDILCKSNPWDSSDCKRENCFTCESSVGQEKEKIKNCRQRSVIYETWCESCKLKRKNGENDEKGESERNEKVGTKSKRNREKENDDDEKIFR